jgi:sigma-B regulation protein RsbU (phosphoserine phosphatase)
LHFRAREGRSVRLEVAGLPLGALDGSRYDERSVELEPGDVLVFHTDGVTEASRGGEDYGFGRLARQLEANASLDAREIGEHILADVNRFLEGASPADDLTFVVFKVT